jgi:hypothetical protein
MSVSAEIILLDAMFQERHVAAIVQSINTRTIVERQGSFLLGGIMRATYNGPYFATGINPGLWHGERRDGLITKL